jgi:hypothetical protein
MALGPNFYIKLAQMSNSLGLKPEDVLAIMQLESGLNPQVPSKAVGLTQFLPSSLRGVGFRGSPDDFRQLSGEEQLPYIERYFRTQLSLNGGPFKSAAQMYVANLWPLALSYPDVKANNPNAIIISSHPEPNPHRTVSIDFEIKAYYANRGLDLDQDGKITLGDLEKFLNKVKTYANYKQKLSEFYAATKSQPTTISPGNEDFLSKLEKFLDQLLSSLASQKQLSIKKYAKKKTSNYGD